MSRETGLPPANVGKRVYRGKGGRKKEKKANAQPKARDHVKQKYIEMHKERVVFLHELIQMRRILDSDANVKINGISSVVDAFKKLLSQPSNVSLDFDTPYRWAQLKDARTIYKTKVPKFFCMPPFLVADESMQVGGRAWHCAPKEFVLKRVGPKVSVSRYYAAPVALPFLHKNETRKFLRPTERQMQQLKSMDVVCKECGSFRWLNDDLCCMGKEQ